MAGLVRLLATAPPEALTSTTNQVDADASASVVQAGHIEKVEQHFHRAGEPSTPEACPRTRP
ncbi:hypothetical protein [Umezawaea tangerina]|uniref:Uncharacterized protein n=1 Tax=Umezawaea tangerina TaxID=84725 RepID=A0A2T0SX81_9PSEU|nr:hypothetical protein [Umezawaea tangerina]PRY38026.1 hypothetical protein CLV43_109246 [Umezawaea tangerina]